MPAILVFVKQRYIPFLSVRVIYLQTIFYVGSELHEPHRYLFFFKKMKYGVFVLNLKVLEVLRTVLK